MASMTTAEKFAQGEKFTADQIDAVVDANVRSLMKNILDTLDKHYPAYHGTWKIRIDTRPLGGVIAITNMAISGQMGFQVPISWIDAEFKVPMRLAGELLERYGLSREKNLNRGDMIDQVNNLDRDFAGEAKYAK